MEKKKNSKHFIIPPAYFKAKGVVPIPVKANLLKEKASETEEQEPKQTRVETTTTEVKETPIVIPKIAIDTSKKPTSGLSLKSIKQKREHQIRQLDVIIDEQELPKEPVEEEDLIKIWNDYAVSVDKKGEKILGSLLQMDTPKLKGNTIHLTYSNHTNKIELERAQYPLLAHLRKTLKNFDLHIEITVNEEEAKKYAFTPQEKYEKLKEKNTNIELLKHTFGLDL